MSDPVIGYKRFSIPAPANHNASAPDAWLLRPSYWTVMGPWKPGENVASCQAIKTGGGGHVPAQGNPPASSHACGLHAFYHLDKAESYVMGRGGYGAVAAVIGWGRMFFDMTWWRAEKTMVVALLDPADTRIVSDRVVKVHDSTREEMVEHGTRFVWNAALEYGVPVLGREEIEEHALLYGVPYDEVISHSELLEAQRKSRNANRFFH